jgi:hypothetical protein
LTIDRRITTRRHLRASLRVRLWNSSDVEHFGESVNLSERGILFRTTACYAVGNRVEVFLKMPSELLGQPHIESRCVGKVVRVEPPVNGKNGVAVAFYRTDLLTGHATQTRISRTGNAHASAAL